MFMPDRCFRKSGKAISTRDADHKPAQHSFDTNLAVNQTTFYFAGIDKLKVGQYMEGAQAESNGGRETERERGRKTADKYVVL